MSDRKYRHKGYQDSGTGSSGGDRGRPFEPLKTKLEGAPRGRSAGAPGPAVFKCSLCGELQRSLGEAEVEPDATCANCDSDLHTCTNCRNFDTSVQWQCRETAIPARVAPKDVRNECGWFTPRIVRDLAADKSPASGSMSSPRTADDARKAFEDLFKK